MLPYVVGGVLSIGVAPFARWVGFDRDRAFYPTVLIVIASYYVLFAVMSGSVETVLLESIVMTIWDYRRALSADGCYAMTGGSNRQLTEALLLGPLLSIGRQQFGNVLVKPNQADLLVLKELCETGKVRPVIDRRFPLSEVSSAVRYVEDGHARGKVVVTV